MDCKYIILTNGGRINNCTIELKRKNTFALVKENSLNVVRYINVNAIIEIVPKQDEGSGRDPIIFL